MQHAKTITIKDNVYLIPTWSPSKWLKMSQRFMNLGGEAFAALFSGEGDIKELNIGEVLKSSIGALIPKLKDEELDQLIKACLEGTRANDKVDVVSMFDAHFLGKNSEMMTVWYTVLEYQYHDFFVDAGARIKSVDRKIPSGEKIKIEVPENLPWPIWRVWLSGKASLSEIEEKWSICDLFDANDALDVQGYADFLAKKRAEAKNGGR